MQLSRFNSLLVSLSNSYTQILAQRDDLTQFNQTQLLLGICQLDYGKKGWLKKEDIISYIQPFKIKTEQNLKTIKTIQSNNQIQNRQDRKRKQQYAVLQRQLERFLIQNFPEEIIAYTMLLGLVLGKEDPSVLQRSKYFKNNLKSSRTNKNIQPQNLIMSIIIEQSHIYVNLPQIIQMIPKFIPSKQKKITFQDLSKYIFSLNIGADANIVMAILNNQINLDLKSKQLVHQYLNQQTNDLILIKQENDKQNIDQQINQMRKINQRLISRVSNFGNQWLFNCNFNTNNSKDNNSCDQSDQ